MIKVNLVIQKTYLQKRQVLLVPVPSKKVFTSSAFLYVPDLVAQAATPRSGLCGPEHGVPRVQGFDGGTAQNC